jgi:signal transduction histidine kinase
VDFLVSPPVELITDDLPLIFADPLFDKAVYNLIENSLRHGGGVTEIRITFSVENYAGLLVFMDNGKGVRPEEKEKIFQNGFGQNTGLGLFLVREILGITDITIHECGTVNVGARFEIRIPSGGWKAK